MMHKVHSEPQNIPFPCWTVFSFGYLPHYDIHILKLVSKEMSDLKLVMDQWKEEQTQRFIDTYANQ